MLRNYYKFICLAQCRLSASVRSGPLWGRRSTHVCGEYVYRDFFQFTPPGTNLVYLAFLTLLWIRIWIPIGEKPRYLLRSQIWSKLEKVIAT
jgi:hypothetical protein